MQVINTQIGGLSQFPRANLNVVIPDEGTRVRVTGMVQLDAVTPMKSVDETLALAVPEKKAVAHYAVCVNLISGNAIARTDPKRVPEPKDGEIVLWVVSLRKGYTSFDDALVVRTDV